MPWSEVRHYNRRVVGDLQFGFFKGKWLPPKVNFELGAVRNGLRKEKLERDNPSSSCFRISGWKGNINSILCGL